MKHSTNNFMNLIKLSPVIAFIVISQFLMGLLRAQEDSMLKKTELVGASQVEEIPRLENLYFLPIDTIPDFATNGIVILGLEGHEKNRLERLLSDEIGRANDEQTVKRIKTKIVDFFNNKLRRPLVAVEIESFEGNRLIIRYVESVLDKDGIYVVGARWTNKNKLIKTLNEYGIEEGKKISDRAVSDGVRWLNSMKFRSVEPIYEQGKNPFTTRIRLEVQDRIPIKPLIAVANTGSESTGFYRFSGGVLIGDAPLPGIFMTGHQATFLYSTNEFGSLHGYSGEYEIPFKLNLPDSSPIALNLGGAYVEAYPELLDEFSVFDSTSRYIEAKANLVVPMKLYQSKQIDSFAGTEFGFFWKSYNSDLEFGGDTVYESNQQVFEFKLNQSVTLRDMYGATVADLSVTYSPGNFNPENTDFSYEQAQAGATANFWIINLDVERLQKLPAGFTARAVANFQFSYDNLLPSEQLSFGGTEFGRGYFGGQFSGDTGVVGKVELLAPSLSLGVFLQSALEIQLIGFLDYAILHSKNASSQYGENQEALSTGVGLRLQWGNRLTSKLDIGWPLIHNGLGENQDFLTQRIQYSVSLSF